jgi:hypothetical protein
MNAVLPPWPKDLPRRFRPLATFTGLPKLSAAEALDLIAVQRARRLRDQESVIRCGGLTTTWTECTFSNRADYTAVASTNAEASLLAGVNEQPWFPAGYFDQANRGPGRGISLLARGLLGTTGTPTIIFQVRLGTTSGSAYLAGTSVGVSAAITTSSGVTNKWWELRLDLICNTTGIGSGNTTLAGAGYVTSPGGFASPFVYALEPTTPDTATWTSTIDNSATQFVNLSVTWSASSASNTITLKQLLCLGLN